jgi:phospholipid/cholesterol/gamma-HCH transport system permease protein
MNATTTAERSDPVRRDKHPSAPKAGLELIEDGSTLKVVIRGDWHAATRLPPPPALERLAAHIERIEIALEPGARADVRALARLRSILAMAESSSAAVELGALPEGMRRLLELSMAVRASATPAQQPPQSQFERIGARVLAAAGRSRALLVFVGEAILGVAAFATGRARYRRTDLWIVVQDVSARALPIVSVVAFLFGAVLAFIGSLQLRPFGAQVFVANLVGSGMALEMGALITAVVMAGRAGAAFAAQIGTMQVNEEIDALNAMGLKPTEFLVVPRIVALGLMSPLLTMYADAVGIAGGMVVGVTMLDISASAYWSQTLQFLEADQFIKGLVKSFVFGILIAGSGCLRGIQCGRSAQAVGEATTSAVVTSIVAIVVADTIITILIFELDL